MRTEKLRLLLDSTYGIGEAVSGTVGEAVSGAVCGTDLRKSGKSRTFARNLQKQINNA